MKPDGTLFTEQKELVICSIDGEVSKTITITLSGLLAGAHLRGPYGVANLLLNNQVSHDEFGTSILRYMEEYSGYNITPADFS